jgi:hypothetical protein
MPFSNGTEFRFARPKFAKAMVWLFGVSGLLGILSWFIAAPAKNWVEGISNLAIVAGLIGFFQAQLPSAKSGKRSKKLKRNDESGLTSAATFQFPKTASRCRRA